MEPSSLSNKTFEVAISIPKYIFDISNKNFVRRYGLQIQKAAGCRFYKLLALYLLLLIKIVMELMKQFVNANFKSLLAVFYCLCKSKC